MYRLRSFVFDVHLPLLPLSPPLLSLTQTGVGTNARQMSLLVGAPLARLHNYHSLALDCPGYGMTKVAPKSKVIYSDWVELVSAFVDVQAAKDEGEKPIVLYGLSAGGMLAYQVACVNKKVKGVVGMTFLDQRVQKVRDEGRKEGREGREGRGGWRERRLVRQRHLHLLPSSQPFLPPSLPASRCVTQPHTTWPGQGWAYPLRSSSETRLWED